MDGARDLLMKCFARYAKGNLILLLHESLIVAAEEIFRITGRDKITLVIADNLLIYDLIELVKLGYYDGIVIRRFDKLSIASQGEFYKEVIQNDWSINHGSRGKIIISANDFDGVIKDIRNISCKIKICDVLLSKIPMKAEVKLSEVKGYGF